MAYSETKSFCPISRNAFNEIRQSLANAGVTLPETDKGEVSAGHGFMVAWDYGEATLPNQPWLSITLSSSNSNFSSVAWGKIEAQISPFVGK